MAQDNSMEQEKILSKNAHEFLMSKGVKSMGEQFTAHQIELWLTEYKSQPPLSSKELGEWVEKEAERRYPYSQSKNLQKNAESEVSANFHRKHFKAGATAAITKLQGERRGEIGEWQLCPKCLGDGNLMRYNSPNMSTTACPVCDVCNGSKIIAKPILNNLS